MPIVIIVEGKNDRSRLGRVLRDDVTVLCTFGTPGTEQVARIRKVADGLPVYIWTDNDSSGKRIRAILGDALPDAEHIYTRKGYAGVEGTPEEYLIQQLEKAGLEDAILYPPPPSLHGESRYKLEQENDERHRKHTKNR